MFKKYVNRIAIEIPLFFLAKFTGLLTKLRYRVVLENEQCISPQAKTQGGTLFLANHTSLMDGIFIGVSLYKYRARPLAIDDQFFNPYVYWSFFVEEAINIPDFSTGTNDFKEKELKKTKETIAAYLQGGENVFIFPSGTLKTQAKEVIGGSSIVPDILKSVRPKEVILIRVSGMWGSSFSLGTGKTSFYTGWGTRFLQILANGIFFMPKRKVILHCEKVIFNPEEGLISINQKLENFFNAPYPEGEPLTLVPYYFWEKRAPPPPQKPPSTKCVINKVLAEEIITEIADLFSLQNSNLSLETRFGSDLGMDSLDLARLSLHFETKYDLARISLDQSYCIADIVRWKEGETGFIKPAFTEIYLPKDEEKREAKRCGDLWNTPFSSYEFEKLVQHLIKQCKPIRCRQVGVMMLNSVEAVALIKALQCLGKIPVLIDWLEGRRFKEQIHEKFPYLPIVTSRFVINTFNFVDVDGLSQQFFWLNETKSLRKFKGELQPHIDNHLLQYFAKDAEVASFSQTAYAKILQEIQSFEIKGKVALIHPFTKPRDVAANLICLDLGYDPFFISSYRVSSQEITSFLNGWDIPYALCDKSTYERLKKFKDLKTRILCI